MIGIEFTLNDGTEAWLEEYFVCNTYEGLEGDDADVRGNLMVIRHALRNAQRIWSKHPVFALNAPEKQAKNPLPKTCMAGMFRSLSKSNSDADGTHLVFVWFQQEEWPVIDDNAKKEILAKPWDEMAQEFSY